MATLYRCVNDDDVVIKKSYEIEGEEEDDVRVLAQEVLDMIKGNIGADAFLESYNSVRAGVMSMRHERKQQRAVMAVVEPEKHAKRRIQQNLAKRDKRKRKNVSYADGKVRTSLSIKKRRVEE
jgi:U3 small nucleolar RNA-associated protein 20